MEPKDETYLCKLRKEYTDINKGCTEMLEYWCKRKPQASWNQLIEVLRMPHIGFEHTANEIGKMLQPEGT